MIAEIFSFFITHGLKGLFAISVISSIIPIPTEPVVFTLIGFGTPIYKIILTLFTGSLLGASIGYVLGRYELRKILSHHYRRHEAEVRTQMQEYGVELLLFISPWIPIVGDLTPIIAGFENYNARKFFIIITLAKAVKSIGLVYLSAAWMEFLARIMMPGQ
jgi:membrane protein YqaA with SNARE-associated domain